MLALSSKLVVIVAIVLGTSVRVFTIDAAIDAAITEVPGRTLITSRTTLIAVLALYLFGGTALGGFAFTVLVGIVAGTWSSVFVAAPVAALLGDRERGRLSDAQQY